MWCWGEWRLQHFLELARELGVEIVMNYRDEEVVAPTEIVVGKEDSGRLHDLEYYTIGSDQGMDEQENGCRGCWWENLL